MEQTNQVVNSAPAGKFGIGDLSRFLLGRRSAIEKVASCKRAWLLGLALVGTAAICREYDAVSLYHHPVDLMAPFAASILLASVLWVWAAILPRQMPGPKRGTAEDYLVFLSMYWLTAPLAWLYAIPVETLFDETTAAATNISFLCMVAFWRVLLFSRCVSVRYRIPFWASLSWITAPCAAVAVVGLFQRRLNLVGIMGGVQLSPSAQLIADFTDWAIAVSFWAVPISLLISVPYFCIWNQLANSRSLPTESATRVTSGLWIVCSLVFLVLAAAASYFQPKFYRAAVVDSLLKQGKVGSAIAQMREIGSRDAFPILWDPPPVNRYPSDQMKGLVRKVHSERPPIWISEVLLERADSALLQYYNARRYRRELVTDDVLQEIAHNLKTKERQELVEELLMLDELDLGSSARDLEEFDLLGIMQAFTNGATKAAGDASSETAQD